MVDARRMAVYRDLFYNNVEGLLAGNSQLRGVLGEERWHALVQDYFARHRAHTRCFHMPQEFWTIPEERGEHPEDLPFMAELAHYEWVETALAIAEEGIDWSRWSRATCCRGSRISWPGPGYRFPVHRIGPDFEPKAGRAHVSRGLPRPAATRWVSPGAGWTARLLALIMEGRGAPVGSCWSRSLELRTRARGGHRGGCGDPASVAKDKDILLGTLGSMAVLQHGNGSNAIPRLRRYMGILLKGAIR
jgi:hypothetical protein